MKYTLFITTAFLAVNGVSASGGSSCDGSSWSTSGRYGGDHKCAPNGYYQSQDYPDCSDQASLNQKCDEWCGKDNSCNGYVAYLNKYRSSYRGKCHYYKSFPYDPMNCDSGYPSSIWGRYRDPILACFYKSKDEASKYCDDKLGKTTKYETKYETKYVTKYETKYETKTVTPTTTETKTKTITKCEKKNGGKYDRRAVVHDTAAGAAAPRAPIAAPAMATNEARSYIESSSHVEARYEVAGRGQVDPPSCLTGSPDPAKVTSACSCIGATGGYVTKYETKYETKYVTKYETKYETKTKYPGVTTTCTKTETIKTKCK